LARELPGIYDAPTILEIIAAGIQIYKTRNQKGERFGEILRPQDFQDLTERFGAKAL
jgi:hypothetical protein